MLKRVVYFLMVVVMVFMMVVSSVAENSMEVDLERAKVPLGESRVELEAWLDSLTEPLGYRPKWFLIMDETTVVVPLLETTLDVECVKEGDDFFVSSDNLDEMIVKENELYSYFPDDKYYNLEGIPESEYIDFYFFREGAEKLRLVLVTKSHFLVSERSTEFRLEQEDYLVPAESFRQLFYDIH